MLEVKDLSVRLDGVTVLRDLSFSIERRAAVAVIGPNGAGKTVLFRAIIGAIPYEGSICWAAGARIGYVPQKLDIDRDAPIAARDLLRARARLAGSPATAISLALGRAGLSRDILPRLIGTLSGGRFQRLLMACALLSEPDVLLLDELTAGVDLPGQERLNATVHRLQEDGGVTVLMISHDISVVSRYATHVLCLTREHKCFGVPREKLSAELLAEAYGEPLAFFRHDEPNR
jgi:zinc transport system ATP-binding protein